MSTMLKLFRIGLFIIILSACFSVRAENQAVNRLRNPGFEYKSTSDGSYGNLPLYWTKAYYGSHSTFAVTDWYKKHGEQCLKLTDSSTALASGLISDPISVNPGYVYSVEVSAMKSVSAMSSSVYLRFYDSTNGVCGNYAATVGSVGYWSSAKLVKPAPTNAVTARLMVYSSGASTGTIYFDSASLVLTDEEVWDGDFGDASAGSLPAPWKVTYTHSNAVQDVQSDGDNALRLYDASITASCGVFCQTPAAPGVPYKLSASVRKADGAGSAMIFLKFYNSAGIQIGDYSISTSSSVYTNLTLAKTAPADTAYAKVLCYLGSTSTGTAYFDDISLTENYTLRYVAPSAVGNGLGTAVTNAACYTNSTFWSGARTLLATVPVKVVMIGGDYSAYWTLASTGNETNHLLISGETPYAVNYCDATNSVENYFIYVSGCKNITFRHLHFTADEDPSRLALKDNEVHDYRGVICLNGSYNMRLEGLSFTDLLMMEASACSVWGPVSHDIIWEYCNFVKTGWDLYDHCIYNTSLASNLNVQTCYFQDCNGVYVRYRSGSKGEVKDNTFISTGTQPTGDIYDRPHWSFVQICAHNNGSNDEILSDELVVSGNNFTFETSVATNGFLAPFWIYAQGPAPTNHPGYHLVPPATGAYIENTANSTSMRNDYLEYYFGINLMTNYLITGNTYSGCWPVLFMMTSEPVPRDIYWTNLPSPIPAENCDLDKLLGLD